IPALIQKVHEAQERGDKKLPVWGDGSPTREFLYSTDAARGIVLATQKYSDAAPVNLGTNSEISIRDLAELICDVMGFDGELVWQTDKPNGQPRRCLDTERAKQAFGFEAKTDFREGLQKTVEWYRKNPILQPA
ncbi:MAG: NAD-dependent epimerase/dehydratase family protein, partial [Cyanobacteria bacterium J06635_11]